jgi:RNA polymerase sigma factor for flagellar operon FliA
MLATDIDILSVWKKYKKAPNQELRNILVEHYAPLVRFNAERVHAKLPTEVDVEDLVSAGLFGLIDAIGAFDMERGVKFETYCSPRVRGAILDELRSMDWVPRLVRNRSQKIQTATKQLQSELGRMPSESEISRKIGVPAEEFKRIRRDGNAVSMSSLSRKAFTTDSTRDVSEVEVLRDDRAIDPQKEMQKADLKSLVESNLTPTERLILVLYYYEEFTMKEIGTTLDLSESRVSQMHSAIVERLRFQLKQRTREFRV